MVGAGISPRLRVQTGSGAHPVSFPMGAGNSFPRVKQPGCEADHSPPSSAEVKNAWSYTSTPPATSWRAAWLTTRYVFMARYLIKHRDNRAKNFVSERSMDLFIVRDAGDI
jgi:hypothetical protein